jgi:hypothetical protein
VALPYLPYTVVNVAASATQCDPLQAAFFASDPLLGVSVGLSWLNLMRCFEYLPTSSLAVSIHGIGCMRFSWRRMCLWVPGT